jgi:hypothetical protein
MPASTPATSSRGCPCHRVPTKRWATYTTGPRGVGVDLLRELPRVVDGVTERLPQDPSKARYYKKGEPYDRWIDWRQPATAIERFVRALWFPALPRRAVHARRSRVRGVPAGAGGGRCWWGAGRYPARGRNPHRGGRRRGLELERIRVGGKVLDAAAAARGCGHVRDEAPERAVEPCGVAAMTSS